LIPPTSTNLLDHLFRQRTSSPVARAEPVKVGRQPGVDPGGPIVQEVVGLLADRGLRVDIHTGEPKPGTGGTVIRFVNDEPIGAGSHAANRSRRLPHLLRLGYRLRQRHRRRPRKTKPPNPFTGTVTNVVFDLKPTHHEAK
jgi:hypothetical protein